MRNTPQPPSISRLGSVTDLMSMVRLTSIVLRVCWIFDLMYMMDESGRRSAPID